MERLPAWDPFYPTPGDPGPRELNEAPLVSLFLCLAGEQAVFCRVEGQQIGPRVSLVARHGTSPFTCGAPARALATIFLGAASGNILAFPARVQANNVGGSQVVQADICDEDSRCRCTLCMATLVGCFCWPLLDWETPLSALALTELQR